MRLVHIISPAHKVLALDNLVVLALAGAIDADDPTAYRLHILIVYLNGNALYAPTPLNPYDEIELGKSKFLFWSSCTSRLPIVMEEPTPGPPDIRGVLKTMNRINSSMAANPPKPHKMISGVMRRRLPPPTGPSCGFWTMNAEAPPAWGWP
mgnify:CR=1 FL=1